MPVILKMEAQKIVILVASQMMVKITKSLEAFSNKRKLKGKQISVSKSLRKLSLKLKEARDQYTFTNVWTQDGKIMFNDDNKVKIYFD